MDLHHGTGQHIVQNVSTSMTQLLDENKCTSFDHTHFSQDSSTVELSDYSTLVIYNLEYLLSDNLC